MARSFNGTSDKITIAANYLSASAGPWTISLWLKSASLTQTNVYLFGDFGPTASLAIIYGFVNDGAGHAQVEFFEDVGAGFRTGSQITILDTNWHHILYRFLGAGSEWAFFLDGTKTVINAAFTGTQGTLTTNCIVAFDGGTVFYSGSLAELAIWTTNLSDANVTSLSGGAQAVKFAPANLVGYWQLCGAASPEPDGSGNGHPGTVTGTTVVTHPKPLCLPGDEDFAPPLVIQDIPTVFSIWGS